MELSRVPSSPASFPADSVPTDVGLFFQKTFSCEPLQLVSTTQSVPCDFWVCLTPPGTKSPTELIQTSGKMDILLQAASQGITEAEPLMMVDSSTQPVRSFYFLPIQKETLSNPLWSLETSRLVLNSIAAWQPQKVGFYLPEPLLHPEDQFRFLTKIFSSLTSEKKQRQYFYLRDPRTDYLKTVQLLLAVKEELRTQGIEDLMILH